MMLELKSPAHWCFELRRRYEARRDKRSSSETKAPKPQSTLKERKLSATQQKSKPK